MMLTFENAVRDAERTGRPGVEGLAVLTHAGISDEERNALIADLTARTYIESVTTGRGNWLFCRLADEGLPLGKAWDVIRELREQTDVEDAEPLLLTAQPVTTGSDAREKFQLWGRASDERVAQIQKASGKEFIHWSLAAMNVCAADGTGGAWKAWEDKHGAARLPGDGVLIAHPDTGYTLHPRLVGALKWDADDPATGKSGRNFVERNNPDARDPLNAPRLLDFPGHGTSTASVIVGGRGADEEPWGVAPGAKILPLRVSSSVVHFSFANVCEAFEEAIARNAHVISLSLGGPAASRVLDDLVLAALDAGIIVVAAAGNYLPTVVFPARTPGVIACAASNALGGPWRFSGMGEEVAVTAPGELVWHQSAGEDERAPRAAASGSGTSFAAANVAGLAALWLSYHGRGELLAEYGGNPGLIPFGFRHALEAAARARQAKQKTGFIRGGGFGLGMVDAEALLTIKPKKEDAIKCRPRVLVAPQHGVINFPVSSWWSILTLPTLTADGPVLPGDVGMIPVKERAVRLENFLKGVLGQPGVPDAVDVAELGGLAACDVGLSNAFARVGQGGRNCVSESAVRRYLLRSAAPEDALSVGLRQKLEDARDATSLAWREAHPELGGGGGNDKGKSTGTPHKRNAYPVPVPPMRRLRAYAFDPSLATSNAAAINEITIPVTFEKELQPGPVGDYVAVVDVDPASDCVYAPVDLNHPYLLAQDGLPRSEGNPQFHQQMVYAVAMKTIGHFEEALGRPIFWSPVRAWDGRTGDDQRSVGGGRLLQGDIVTDGTEPDDDTEPEDGAAVPAPVEKVSAADDRNDRFVRRLRIYPHALRDQNAYYSPPKRAILFGYFPAGDGDPGAEYPGGVVFTCLAHDIIAHEITHAILDGMHVYFTEPSNPDVFAFHEAFADIVALFQRFTYPELLQDQIARARGRLEAGTLMTQLALQFGQATGRHQALRDALGRVVEQERTRQEAEFRDRRLAPSADGGAPPVTIADAARDLRDEETRRLWKRFQADPALVAQVTEPHERGTFLVAAVFDAYLRIYEERVADLRRIATGGTGVLPDGELHPDLVNRMANEASKSARHVLRMCIRAMDYVPPADITFGEFLRALITADADLVPDDNRRYRVAFIEAFRKWGIYPRNVRTLSEESLRWTAPGPDPVLLFADNPVFYDNAMKEMNDTMRAVRASLLDWQPGKERARIFEKIQEAQKGLHAYFAAMPDGKEKDAILNGIDTRRTFRVTNLRPARRIGPQGEFLTEMVVEVLQSGNALPTNPEERRKESDRRRRLRAERQKRGEPETGDRIPFRGGVTLIVDMDDFRVKYVIHKRLDSASREARQRDFLLRAGGHGSPDAAEYSSENLPAGWYTDPAVSRLWQADRDSNVEAMRASSCACRRFSMEDSARKKAARAAAQQAGLLLGNPLGEPFALLHKG